MLSEITKMRLQRFNKNKRAKWSFWILSISFILSLFSTVLVNHKPIYLNYQGQHYFPLFTFYPETSFGGNYKTEANYHKLMKNDKFLSACSFIIRSPIAQDPLYSDLNYDTEPPYAPSKHHLLGTDLIGRDILARLIYGFRNCMCFSLLLTLCSTIIGIIIGAVQGFFGKKVDFIMQRIIEIWDSLPFLYVVIVIGAIYGRNFWVLLLVMSLFSWIGLSYYIRADFFKIRNATYVKVAQVSGISSPRILFHHILPNALTSVVTLLPFSIIAGISALTSLDFLGFGFPPPTPSWGELLAQGLDNIYAPWIAMSTVFALFITLLLTAFIGEGVRDAFDPKGDPK